MKCQRNLIKKIKTFVKVLNYLTCGFADVVVVVVVVVRGASMGPRRS